MLSAKHDMDASVPTIAEVLSLLRTDRDLSRNRRIRLRAAILTLIKHTRLDPDKTKASYSACRGVISRFEPASANISRRWWRHVQTRVSSAFNRYGGASYYRKGDRLAPDWQMLRDGLPDLQFVRRLTRFIRYCNHGGIRPANVTDQTSSAFYAYLSEGTSVANPKKRHRQMCHDWNRAVRAVPGWPAIVLTVPVYNPRFTLPLSAFPRSFAADLDAWSTAGTTADPFGPRTPRRPLQPITIATKRGQLRYFASALVHAGLPIGRIRTLGTLVEPRTFEKGIAYLWNRGERRPSKWLSEVATEVAQVAKVWVRVDPTRYAAMRKVANRLCPPREVGVSARNRQILRQFDDPANIEKLLHLPQHLAAMAGRMPHGRKAAYLMQMALAIELLLVAPIRVGSLHRLRRTVNIVYGARNGRHAGPVHLVIPPHSVKNAVPLEFELPVEAVRLLHRYTREYLPFLSGKERDVLFPGEKGEPKLSTGLAKQIKQTVAFYTGLVVNVHAFRHIAARLYLERFPQEYFLVGLLLGHRSVLTTMRNYCELGVRSAARQYSEHVLGRHFNTRCSANALFAANRRQALQQARTGWRWK